MRHFQISSVRFSTRVFVRSGCENPDLYILLDFVCQPGINVGSDSFSLSLLPLVLILFGLLSLGLVSLDLISDYLNN